MCLFAGATPALAAEKAQHQAAYVVRQGDTLASIANAKGLDLARLAAHNGLAPDARLTPGQSLALPGQPPRAKAQARPSLSSQIAPKSAWETMTESSQAPGPRLKGENPAPVVIGPADTALSPDLRVPVDAVPAPQAPTQGAPRVTQRQAIGVKADIVSKGSTKVSGVVSPVETSGQNKTAGQNDTGGSGAGAGVILRHEF